MLKNIAAATALLACTLSPGAALAAPIDAGSIARSAQAANPVEQVRLFCANRFTGRFLHWGGCGPTFVYYRPHPRVYCRNRYSGAFLHWGFC